ncbi:MAG: hypothetical protein P4L69_03155 [Desulfosporosinus sp.]|nr:hypothetical protein [Desulfosporosinus sp.]
MDNVFEKWDHTPANGLVGYTHVAVSCRSVEEAIWSSSYSSVEVYKQVYAKHPYGFVIMELKGPRTTTTMAEDTAYWFEAQLPKYVVELLD